MSIHPLLIFLNYGIKFYLMRKKIFTVSTLAALASIANADNAFYYNQVGYDVGQPVSVIVESDKNLEGVNWTLFGGGSDGMLGGSIKGGTFGAGVNPDNWSKNGKYYVIDLGDSLKAGTYYVSVNEGTPSTSDYFVVAENALAANTLKSVMDYFYKDRADKDPIVGWDKSVPLEGSGTKVDVHGGWYDASGDVSKYLSHLSYANYLNPQQIPLTVWALAFAAEKMPAALSANPSTVTAVDEAIYGADFLVRMLSEEGYFYMTVFDSWGQADRSVCAFSGSEGTRSSKYQTAFREGGGMAIAGLARASMLKKNGDYTSEQYLAAAKKGFEHLQSKQSIGGSCAYCDDGKENIIDDYTALLAAMELYSAGASSEKHDYYNEALKRAEHLIDRLSDEGFFWSDDAKTRPFWHASDAGLPLVALCRFAELAHEMDLCPGGGCASRELPVVKDAISKHLNWLISVTNEVGNPFGYARQTAKTQNTIKNTFFIPHDNESNYWWQGEDARLASLSAAAVYATKVLGDTPNKKEINKYATDQLDWILGKNPYGVCMMYKKGKKNPAIYDGSSNYDATLEGGIANGISGLNTDGSGIVWDDVNAINGKSWDNWRWIEQWLPHSTWYLMALATRYDEVTREATGAKDGIVTQIATGFNMSLNGRTLIVNLQNAKSSSIQLTDLKGRKVMNQPAVAGHATLNLQTLKSGVYMVKVGNTVKKIAVK